MTAACIDDQEIHAAQNTSIGFGEGGEGKGAGCDGELAEGEAMVDGKALTFKYDTFGTESTNSDSEASASSWSWQIADDEGSSTEDEVSVLSTNSDSEVCEASCMLDGASLTRTHSF